MDALPPEVPEPLGDKVLAYFYNLFTYILFCSIFAFVERKNGTRNGLEALETDIQPPVSGEQPGCAFMFLKKRA